jgi:hypothetical protein
MHWADYEWMINSMEYGREHGVRSIKKHCAWLGKLCVLKALSTGAVWRERCGWGRHILSKHGARCSNGVLWRSLSKRGLLHMHGPPLHFSITMIPL